MSWTLSLYNLSTHPSTPSPEGPRSLATAEPSLLLQPNMSCPSAALMAPGWWAAQRVPRKWENIVVSLMLSLLGIRRRGPGTIAEEVEVRQNLDELSTDSEDEALEEWARRRYWYLRDD